MRLLRDMGTVGSHPFRDQEKSPSEQTASSPQNRADRGRSRPRWGRRRGDLRDDRRGRGTTRRTVVASVPAQQTAQTVATTTDTLTQLYKNAAPGVVDITVVTGHALRRLRPPAAAVAGRGLGLRDRHEGRHRHERSTSSPAPPRSRSASRTARPRRRRSSAPTLDRHRGDQGRRRRVAPPSALVGRLQDRAGRRERSPRSAARSACRRRMTAGIVSALGRTITAPNNYSISGAIQTDAADQPRQLRRPAAEPRAAR